MTAAKVISFPKQNAPQPSQEAGKSMYSDKFHQGYVMSSRLYRKEVWPFLSDAARNVYAELENRINGHNKESDFVSYSQLQGGDLEGSRKMGRTSVSNALQELIKLGVITVISNGKRGTKSYRLNEVSLKDQFTNGTSTVTGLVQQQDQNQSTNETTTSPVTGHTIDSSIDSLEFKKNRLLVDKSKSEMFSESIEYHGKDKTEYSLRELAGVYTVQSDFKNQAKQINPKLDDDEKIMSELKNFAQWSTSQNKTTAQGWMNFWIYRIKNLKTSKPRNSYSTKTDRTSDGLTPKQILKFAPMLCAHPIFSGKESVAGESEKSFIGRIGSELRKPENQRKWMNYLHDCGFKGNLEGCEA